MPICAFAAATARSAAAMSGRRCSSADGTTSGTAGHASRSTAPTGDVELGRRLADQHRDRVLEPRALADHRDEVRLRRLELRLRLQHVGALRDAGVVLVLRDLQRALV